MYYESDASRHLKTVITKLSRDRYSELWNPAAIYSAKCYAQVFCSAYKEEVTTYKQILNLALSIT